MRVTVGWLSPQWLLNAKKRHSHALSVYIGRIKFLHHLAGIVTELMGAGLSRLRQNQDRHFLWPCEILEWLNKLIDQWGSSQVVQKWVSYYHALEIGVTRLVKVHIRHVVRIWTSSLYGFNDWLRAQTHQYGIFRSLDEGGGGGRGIKIFYRNHSSVEWSVEIIWDYLIHKHLWY